MDPHEEKPIASPTPIKPNRHRETTIYAKSGALDTPPFLNTRKGSTSSIGSSSGNGNGGSGSGPSFTQRLIERGVAVPSSFSSWDKVRPSEESSSPGSFDFDSYYGMSPFITPSFSTAAEAASHFQHDGALYKSLRHRYEKEKTNSGSSIRLLSEDEEDGGVVSSPEFTKKSLSETTQDQKQRRKDRTEDSDIELSDEEEEGGSITPTQNKLFPLTQRPRRSRSPLSFQPATDDGIFDIYNPQSYEEQEEPVVLSETVERLKKLLITKPPTQQPKPLPSPPRQHLLQTPVFQVVNANSVKDRYLFLFNDLLLICKPIMDENIIVSTSTRNSSERNRYRFRPNENSLFQVKNIVQLGQLTLYISKEDYYTTTSPNSAIEIGMDGRPILPPARKIHPIMASALRKFETNANLGIQYLVDKGVLTHDPLSIANFLFKTPDLNRRQLGYYLSDLKNADVYDAFLECFRLVGLRLDEALRILLTTFRLPSNWESLEYLIERFAKKWHDANQNVIKFHEDMVVKVVVAMLFLNAEYWYDATSERDVFWYARELKERQDRQAKRKMSVIDYHRTNIRPISKLSSSATTASSNSNNNNNRQSVTVEPLHYIMALRERGDKQPTLEDFLERWNYYDQYHLVPREFMEEMYKSIMEEKFETGWDNKTGKRIPTNEEENGVCRPKVVSPSVQQGSQDVVITVIPHRLPTRLTKGTPSEPIAISIPSPDKGLQIKLRGQDLEFKPNVLDFSNSCIQTFTITGNTLGRTSLMFIKTGENAGNYVSPTLPRTKSVVVERPFMRFTFQIGFKHSEKDSIRKKQDKKKKKSNTKEEDEEEEEEEEEAEKNPNVVNRKYTFSVETEEERIQWLEALKKLGGYLNEEANQANIDKLYALSSESRVALQVLKEVLLADEIKKGTVRSADGNVNTPLDENHRHDRTIRLLLPKKNNAEDIVTTSTTANVVTKRGHEIIKLVVQNSMVPLVLGFLKNQIP
ncbi:uncharacterized protein EV154DRAFT_533008 [Mucor mucedo]|uniref:uncharacterized protein n=1 Tax=Mucor mucedo TaxID=29922 RepID=UPI00221F00FF|nr:uncharacterized protein EV154DRAFT_533008 [Mucor mucedo]KAI7865744.1 hypothetical protein EV154DRAFT_533008 [Mucor mucedo]